MLLRSIRSQLLGLVLATVVPFTALIAVGLWNQWQRDQAAAIQRASDEARLIAAQVDDHIGNLENRAENQVLQQADVERGDRVAAVRRHMRPQHPPAAGTVRYGDRAPVPVRVVGQDQVGAPVHGQREGPVDGNSRSGCSSRLTRIAPRTIFPH